MKKHYIPFFLYTMYRFLSSSCVTSIHALHMLMCCIYASSIHALYSVFFKHISQAHLFMRCVLLVLSCISILFIFHCPLVLLNLTRFSHPLNFFSAQTSVSQCVRFASNTVSRLMTTRVMLKKHIILNDFRPYLID